MRYFLKNTWFTLIELLVVTSILILVSVSWVFYFNSFVNSYSLKSELSLLKDSFDELDNKVKSKEIYDYELYLSALSLLTYNYQNLFDNDYIQAFNSIDLNSWSWYLSLKPHSWWEIWQLDLYADNIFLEQGFLDSWDTFSYNFINNQNYKLTWYFSWSLLNDININYFSETNLDKEKQDFLELLYINTQEDKLGDSISNLIIKNIWWKKELIWDWTNYDELYLFFERAWYSETLKISK